MSATRCTCIRIEVMGERIIPDPSCPAKAIHIKFHGDSVDTGITEGAEDLLRGIA